MNEDELIALAKRHSLGGLAFDRKGLMAFAKSLKQKPMSKEALRRLFSHGVRPSAEFWYDFARAIEKSHGIGVNDD
jgi:hypothetical protein